MEGLLQGRPGQTACCRMKAGSALRCSTFCAGIIGDSLTVGFPLTTLLLRQRHSLLGDFAGDLAREPLWKLNDFHGSVPECALKHR